MDAKKNSGLYVALLAVSVVLLFLLIYLSYQNKLHLSLQLYFFILFIFALGATAFLTSYLRSSAEWSGTFMKGNLKMVGSVVVFILIFCIGYYYRPVPENVPFNLTVFLVNDGQPRDDFHRDTLKLTLGNSIQRSAVGPDGQAFFPGIDPRYLGQPATLLGELDRHRISKGTDTLVTLPESTPFSLRFRVFPDLDSTLFQGFVLMKNPNRPSKPVVGGTLQFTDADRTVVTDSAGHFSLYLVAREGDATMVNVLKKNKLIFSGPAVLSKNMQLLTGD